MAGGSIESNDRRCSCARSLGGIFERIALSTLLRVFWTSTELVCYNVIQTNTYGVRGGNCLMGHTQSWRVPEDVDLLPVHPAFLSKITERGICEGHIYEVVYDDPEMVAVPVKRGRRKSPPGAYPVLLMGSSSRGLLEIGANYFPRDHKLFVFHANELQDKYRQVYNELRKRL